jgi:hypothetical protein
MQAPTEYVGFWLKSRSAPRLQVMKQVMVATGCTLYEAYNALNGVYMRMALTEEQAQDLRSCDVTVELYPREYTNV